MSQGCVTMNLFNENLRLKSVIEGSKNDYRRRDTFHRRGDCRGDDLCCGLCCAGLWISDFGGVLLSWRILGRGVAGVLGSGVFLGCRLKRRAKLALSSNHCSR